MGPLETGVERPDQLTEGGEGKRSKTRGEREGQGLPLSVSISPIRSTTRRIFYFILFGGGDDGDPFPVGGRIA